MSQANTKLNNEYPVYLNGELFYPFNHETLQNSEKKVKSKCSSSEQHPRGVVSVVKIITTNKLEEPRYKRKNKLLNTKSLNNNSIFKALYKSNFYAQFFNRSYTKSCYFLPIKLENDQEDDDYAKPELRIVRVRRYCLRDSCDNEVIKCEKENFQLKNENSYLKNLISKLRDSVKNLEDAKNEQDSNDNKCFQLNKKIYVLQTCTHSIALEILNFMLNGQTKSSQKYYASAILLYLLINGHYILILQSKTRSYYKIH
ncbi:hypothetical protein BpHYR1_035869 [Brachionus plicatilis]|uniref:Uncharacterized protein n=1 Tax=Brachionus plicatilis TaxID=10195 RepID=A0A3M7PDQ0_BRAPC|nr:hypothetical protein BpHYR1_035869 [Brachionus plicatilis]